MVEKNQPLNAGVDSNIDSNKRCTVPPVTLFERLDQPKVSIENQGVRILEKLVVFLHMARSGVVIRGVTGIDQSYRSAGDTVSE